MGRRGPAPEPVAAKLARGETRPSRVNLEAPVVDRALRMPRDMSPRAKAVWKRVTRAMEGTGVLTAADEDLLRAYCDTVASYVRHRALVDETGTIVQGARGRELVVNPVSRIVHRDLEMMRLLTRELGLSPAARAGLRVDLMQSHSSIDDVIGPPLRLVVGGEE